MMQLRFLLSMLIFMSLSLPSCGQLLSRNVRFFENTRAYELAKAIGKGNLKKIEKIVKEDPTLLSVAAPISGSNVLVLAIYEEEFKAFKKLLELGADPNYTDPYTKYSVLIESIAPFGTDIEWKKDTRYAALLLYHGANPNYAVENNFTNEKGHHIMATSPMMEAAALDMEYMKLLIKYGADPLKKLQEDQRTPFSVAVSMRKFDLINYFIDSLKVDVHQPMSVVKRKPDNKVVTFYIQDYLKQYMSYQEGSEGYQKKQELIRKLEGMGVDFKNYEYKF